MNNLEQSPFVGRQREMSLVRKTASQVKEGEKPLKNLINFVEIKGIGKTRLLTEIGLELSTDGFQVIDLAPSQFQPRRSSVEYANMDERLNAPRLDMLQTFSRIVVPDDLQWFDRWGLSVQSPFDAIHNAGIALATIIRDKSADRPVVFIMDDWHNVESLQARFLYHAVFNTLNTTDARFMAVCSSEQPLRFVYPLHYHSLSSELGPFNHKETRAQLGLNSRQVRRLHEYTMGLPFLNEKLGKTFRHIDQFDREDFVDMQLGLLSELEIFELAGSYGPELKILSFLRLFEISSMKALLEPTLGYSRSYRDWKLLLDAINATKLLRVNRETNLMEVHPLIRKVLRKAVEITDPDLAQRVSAYAINSLKEDFHWLPLRRALTIRELVYQLSHSGHSLKEGARQIYELLSVSSRLLAPRECDLLVNMLRTDKELSIELREKVISYLLYGRKSALSRIS